MKNKAILILLITLFLASNVQLTAQFSDDFSEKGDVGIGMQVCSPFYGASAIFNIKNKIGIQSMFGLNGNVKSVAGRILFYLSQRPNFSTYMYGLYGQYTYTSYDYGFWSGREKISETIYGHGFGLGVEYKRSDILPGLPFWVNMEVGYGDIEFHEVIYNTSAIVVGVGLHFYFSY